MAASGIDRAAHSPERLSRATSTSYATRWSAVHEHLQPSLFGDKRERSGGIAPTCSSQQSEARHSEASSARRQGGTDIMQQEAVNLSASLVKDRARSLARIETVNVSKHGLSQYRCAPRGFVIGYSSPAHILKQRARSHAIMGLAHGVTAGEESPASELPPNNDSSMCQNVVCWHSTNAPKQHQSAPCQRLPREDEEASFHTLRSTSLFDVRDYVRAEGAAKYAVPVRLRSPSTSAGELQASCSGLSSKPCPLYSRRLPPRDRNGRGEVREAEAASLYADRACPAKGGPTVAETRACAQTVATYTGLTASVRKAQPAANPEIAAERLHTSVNISGISVNDATAHNTRIDRELTNSCVGRAVLKASRSVQVPVHTYSHQRAAHIEPYRGSMREHVFSAKKKVVQRELQPSSRVVLSGDHSSANRGGRTLRVLPAPPPFRHKSVGGQAQHRVCEVIKAGGLSASRSLPTQNRPDCASSIPPHIGSLSRVPRVRSNQGHLLVDSEQPSPFTHPREHGQPEAFRVTLSNPSCQLAPSYQADPCVASQITEHSWMFPRDEYRPPLSPHIPFNLDEDEDATASALLVNLTDDLRPPKREFVKGDESGDAGVQIKTGTLKKHSEQGEYCQAASSGSSPGTAENRSTGRNQRRRCTAHGPSNCRGGEGAPGECERSKNAAEALIGNGGEGTGLPKAEHLPATVECLSGSHFVSSQAGGKPHTPPTDWCTTLSTAWLSSSATAAENSHHVSSPVCRGTDVEPKTKPEPMGRLKTVNHSTDYGIGSKPAGPSVGAAAVPVPASKTDPPHPPADHPADHSGYALASQPGELSRGPCSTLAEVQHIFVSGRVTLKRDHVESLKENVTGGKIPTKMGEALAQPRTQMGPTATRRMEELNEGHREHSARVTTVSRAVQSSCMSILVPHCGKGICHSLSDSAFQQHPPLRVHHQYTYKPSTNHPPILGPEFLDRANAFERHNRPSVRCATKKCSVDLHTGDARQSDPPGWQTTDNEVEPSASSSLHSGSVRDSTDYPGDESTTSDDCSSDCTSEQTSTSSPLPQKTGASSKSAPFPCTPFQKKSQETFFLSQRRRSPLLASTVPGRLAVLAMLPEAQGNLQEADSNKGGVVHGQDPPARFQKASQSSCPGARALEDVAKDLAVTRMLSTYQRTESLNSNNLTGRRQSSILVVGEGSLKHSGLANKEQQPSFRERRRWRFWGWTFGRRNRASILRREP